MNQDNANFLHVVGEPTFEALARYIERNNVTKILVMAGAGISVAAGIPDFRSPHTGIYARLGKYNLNSPTDAFSLTLLRERPDVFYSIVREMDLWPGHFWPTLVHHFIKLLADEGRLLRCCTQNIDGLERASGLPMSFLVEAHGSFSTASCIECRSPYDIELASRESRNGKVPHCDRCGGVVKPDVVFFGESLPDAFFNVFAEITEVELLLIMGTSLQVHPFAELAVRVRPDVPRVLFNLERVGGAMFRFPTDEPTLNSFSRNHTGNSHSSSNSISSSSSSSDGYGQFATLAADAGGICRDIFFPGDCQLSVRRLAEAMGLGERLSLAVREGEKKRESYDACESGNTHHTHMYTQTDRK
ncbi:putative silent information regulator 2 [Trypanosoma cruzi]|uniref:NAD-dependent protein deacetylase n=2 Tax=Trypanosoma cruzi TaxID=5693 RepID=V5BZF3_TRYCR|nr:silent information regulator 2 [Trypanosoma cruzi Dm28c]PBJ73899.1 silent information regulator 2 (SIR2RP1) [Trypanosoma cruzi cruzi]PWU99678.1 Silent information regulator 2 related protein 1 [Trypanosoma cruzi]RNF20076.1 putative silent information regulator 2 [Trypanosoma cruzi]